MGVLSRVVTDDLLRLGTFMFIATGITGAVNVLFRVIMARMLTVGEFGQFNAVFSLAFFITMVLTRTVRTGTADLVSSRTGRGDAPLSGEAFWGLLRGTAIASAAFSIAFLLLSTTIMDFLGLDSTGLVLAAVPFLALSFVLPVNLGVFQGHQRFLPLAITNISQASFKVISSALFVLMGLGTVGAMMGAGIGTLLAFLVSLAIVLRLLGDRPAPATGPAAPTGTGDVVGSANRHGATWLDNGRDGITAHVLVATVGLALLTNMDVVVVAHFFTTEGTGLYSAAATLGRMVYFLPLGFSLVLYPRMVEARARGEGNGRTLAKGLAYVGAPVLAATFVLGLTPSLPIRLILGEKFMVAEGLVGLYAVLMLVFSMVTVLVYYLLAERRYLAVHAFTAISFAQLGVVWFHHPDLESVLRLLIWANVLFLLLSSFVVLATLRREGGALHGARGDDKDG